MLATTKYTKYFSTIDYRVIVNMPNSLSFNFSRVDLLSNKWYSLLSILISTPKVSIYSK